MFFISINCCDEICSGETASEGSSEGSDANSQNVSFMVAVPTNFMHEWFALGKDRAFGIYPKRKGCQK